MGRLRRTRCVIDARLPAADEPSDRELAGIVASVVVMASVGVGTVGEGAIRTHGAVRALDLTGWGACAVRALAHIPERLSTVILKVTGDQGGEHRNLPLAA